MNYERLRNCRLYVLDMDGTLYLGDEVLEGSISFVKKLDELGLNYVYLTNNSSKSAKNYYEKLERLGFPCAALNSADELSPYSFKNLKSGGVFTSGMATAEYLLERYPKKTVYAVGTAPLLEELRTHGISLFNDMPESKVYKNTLGEDGSSQSPTIPDIVLIGFDTELDYKKLDRAVSYLRKGAIFIAANPDFVCPMPHGEVLPDCGSICALISAATGLSPKYIGKPERNMIDALSKKFDIPSSEICCVGDRLYTDIAVAKNAGCVSALVLSGETTIDMLENSNIQPDYVFAGVSEINLHLGNK